MKIKLTVEKIREEHFKEYPNHEKEFPSFYGQNLKFVGRSLAKTRKINPNYNCITCVLLMEILKLNDDLESVHEQLAGEDI